MPQREDRPFPGRFLEVSALLYPWRPPTLWYWMGLSFMTALAGGLIAATTIVMGIVIAFGLVGSIFTMAAMGLACLGVSGYVLATFTKVVEDTAEGEDRLHEVPGIAWHETFPPFLQTMGAALLSGGLAFGFTYPMRDWMPWYDLRLLGAMAAIAYHLFPVFLLTNLADGSFVPLLSLPAVIARLIQLALTVALFFALSYVGLLVIGGALLGLSALHPVAGIAAAGPLVAAWLMYYGHWLGRLGRRIVSDCLENKGSGRPCAST
jgi:hypothetical protein